MAIDVREIKLDLRYPNSRQEDITGAFMRGYTGAVEIGNKAIEKLESENAKLRELVADMQQAWWACDIEKCPRYDERCDTEKFCTFDECARELGIEVKA